ncbi:aa3-type cytochrome oxidase subunit II [Actinocatenispora comari]|uniref:cytochrome-c oxidase n=1 Tax=Actinocatenispora comari TaxID=2807577 RepID=A0A8J4ELT7_9ACTN|nr:cytochrome c oxidase subunit II [Actinocatenispora comari]
MVAGPTDTARASHAPRPTASPRRRSARRVAAVAFGGAALLTSLAGCSAKDAFAFGWPHGGITPQAHKMYNMWIGSTIAALCVGVLVWGLIFWCVVRYRKRGERLPVQTRYNLPIELVYSIVPFFVIAVLFYYTAITESYVNKTSKHPDATVHVVAFKWNWQFQYPDAKGSNGQPVQTTGTSSYIPVLVVPTHKKVQFVEDSEDVIHSFWVPELLFKRDVFPGGTTNKFEVTIEKEGAYVGRCAELCGTYHSQMNFEMRAVSWTDYQKFLQDKQKGMSTPAALRDIGQAPYATTTHPFDTDRTSRTAS